MREYADRTGQELAGIYVDSDVSASTPLRDRPEGSRLWARLSPGDCVAITTRDRAFRSLIDAASTLMEWRERGIRLHICDFPIDLTTDEGELVFLQGAVFSQYERRATSRRTKKNLAHRKKNGIPYGASRPWGWVRKGDEYVPCEKEQTLGRYILQWKESGLTMADIADHCLRYRKPDGLRGHRTYHRSDIYGLAAAARAGYPKLPQSVWRVRGYAQTQHAGLSGAPQKSS